MNNAKFITVEKLERDDFSSNLEELMARQEVLSKLLKSKEFKRFRSLFLEQEKARVKSSLTRELDMVTVYRLQGEFIGLSFMDTLDNKLNFISQTLQHHGKE